MNTIVTFPRKTRADSVEAEIRLKQRARTFESPAERLNREALEQLRRSDDYAIKLWLEDQMIHPAKQPTSLKTLDYLIGLLLFAGGVISIIFVGAVFGLILER